MNKQEIYTYLAQEHIWHEIAEHEAVYNMEEASHLEVSYPGCDAKNLFVRDDKRRNYYLITVKGDKRVDLKEFRRQHSTRSLSFASAEDLMEIMGLTPGAVSPLGLLNDPAHRAALFLDQDLLHDPGHIGVHPNDNTATVWLNTDDLIRLLEAHGTAVTVFEP